MLVMVFFCALVCIILVFWGLWVSRMWLIFICISRVCWFGCGILFLVIIIWLIILVRGWFCWLMCILYGFVLLMGLWLMFGFRVSMCFFYCTVLCCLFCTRWGYGFGFAVNWGCCRSTIILGFILIWWFFSRVWWCLILGCVLVLCVSWMMMSWLLWFRFCWVFDYCFLYCDAVGVFWLHLVLWTMRVVCIFVGVDGLWL